MQSGERVVAVCSFSEWSGKAVIVIIFNDEKKILCAAAQSNLCDFTDALFTRSPSVQIKKQNNE